MPQDEIIQQVRETREAYAERFGFDIRRIYLNAKEHESQGGREVVRLEPKPVTSAPKRKASK